MFDFLFFKYPDCISKINRLKLVSHWGVTVGDNLQTAVAREFLKCLKTFVGVINSLAESQGFAQVLREFWTCSNKFVQQIFSQNSHRVVAGVLNPSQFSFRKSESVRNVRQLCEELVT